MSADIDVLLCAFETADWQLASTRVQRLDSSDLLWNGPTVLESAIEHEAPKHILENLIRRCKKSKITNVTSSRSLHAALVRQRSGSRARMLLDAGLDPNGVNNYGESILSAALANRVSLDSLQLLLDYGADLNLRNHFGTSPLVQALECSASLEVILCFLKYGADPYLPGDACDRNACEVAALGGMPNIGHVFNTVRILVFLRSAATIDRIAKRSSLRMLPMEIIRSLRYYLAVY